ncbi:undecaprenyl-phosphate glucose phosphotransferase [Paraburkholderia lycopersici]|uniref:Undecaprenyl-phosphate glucose phosphotransferase n=1 Tax=Paraburkholderia lycopersici TaxID=416944 RepID=A0A1G6XX63_9BURK|nr:Undecaprenyl-phosphate glucose phosphotransferase [Paraburkholderia lycopersici]
MLSTAHTDTSVHIWNGGTLARFSDAAVIAAGAVLTTGSLRISDWSGCDSALVSISILVSLMLFPACGMYCISRQRVFWRCVCVPMLAWLFALCASCFCVMALHHAYRPSIEWLETWAFVSATGVVLPRVVAHGVCLRLMGQGTRIRTVAVVGNSGHCQQLIRKVSTTRDSMYRVTAVFDTDPQAHANPPGLPTFRDREAFAAYIRNTRIEELWLAVPLSEGQTIIPFLRLFRSDLINIRFIPDVSGLTVFNASMANLDGTSAINLVASPVSSHWLIGKELFDRVFALCVVLFLAPVFLAIAVAVKYSSPGPVLFIQRRKGANGKIFNIYKFRSMRVHVEAEGVLKQATRNDPRITRVGAFLRRTSLDELPQFLNVLRGEMSIVGPRPHAIEHDELYRDIVDGYIHRYRIKPGITGWAQINGFRGETDRIEKMQGRVAHDLYYLRNWSFWLDVRIVIATIFKGLVHRNAY